MQGSICDVDKVITEPVNNRDHVSRVGCNRSHVGCNRSRVGCNGSRVGCNRSRGGCNRSRIGSPGRIAGVCWVSELIAEYILGSDLLKS